MKLYSYYNFSPIDGDEEKVKSSNGDGRIFTHYKEPASCNKARSRYHRIVESHQNDRSLSWINKLYFREDTLRQGSIFDLIDGWEERED